MTATTDERPAEFANGTLTLHYDDRVQAESLADGLDQLRAEFGVATYAEVVLALASPSISQARRDQMRHEAKRWQIYEASKDLTDEQLDLVLNIIAAMTKLRSG